MTVYIRMSDFNPFAALVEDNTIHSKRKDIDSILQDIFAFTLDFNISEKKQVLYLEEVAKTFNRNDLDVSILQHALFDRLFMCNEENLTIKNTKQRFRNTHASEEKVIIYLCNCYRNLNDENNLEADEKLKIKSLIIQNAVTALLQSEIYEGQQLENQLIDVLKDNIGSSNSFFKDICKGVLDEDDGGYIFWLH